MDEDYFISISDPAFLERSLLSDAKASLEFSIINQNIKTIKVQKAELFSKIKDDVDEIISLLAVLNEKLPHKELLKAVKSKPASKSSVSSKKKGKQTYTPATLTKMDKLNSSLADIERRLKDLS